MSDRHFDIETISKYFLGHLTPDEEIAVQQHICECEECKKKIDGIRALHNVFFENNVSEHKQYHHNLIYRVVVHSRIFKIAAAVIIICGIGFVSFRYASQRESIYEQQILNNGRSLEDEVFAIDSFERDDSIYYEEKYGPDFYR